MVSVTCSRARARRADNRRRPRCVSGDLIGALDEIARASDPSLAIHAVGDRPPGRWEERLDDPDRAFVFEAVYEGFQLHYGEPRLFRGMDADLRLLSGDALYALGLERLAECGDLVAVAELADLISMSARAVADHRPELVEELWEASLNALSRGGSAGVSERLGRRFEGVESLPVPDPGGGRGA